MGKAYLKSIVVILGVFVLSLTTFAQRSYRVPSEMPIEKKVEKAFPGFFGTEFSFPQLLSAKFYPIGFSRDGKFAYAYEPVDEACGCYFANIVIQDLKTDKTLWELDFDQGELMDGKGEMLPIDTLPKVWKYKSKLINSKLREHKIVAGNLSMVRADFDHARRSFAVSLDIERGTDDVDISRITKATVSLTASGIGSKVVFSSSYDKVLFINPLDASVLGAVKSPYEDRIAILLIEVRRGYEGPPHITQIKIIGADLKSGFVP
ncbi:MAG: hypothetical protein KF756_03570 [Acidobacteria bacterium]|nr:hypothetical protein [Acidobacteriota bacterium]